MSTPARHALPVSIRALSKHYGSVKAVDDASLDIEAGELMTLLGPSGSGKTTLLMMIAGFSRPTQGSIRIGAEEIVHLPPHKRDIGMVFQNYALFPHMNVAANIAYPLRIRGLGAAEREARVKRALDLVQLVGYGERRIDQLSGGQRQRIALARAIVFEPRILLMDEPLSALDKQLRETMQIEIRKLHDRLGMTTISVTHDQREALTMSNRIAVFSQGRLMQVATPDRLYARPESRFVAQFIGESHFLAVTPCARGLCYQGTDLKLAEPDKAAVASPLLMLRPERLTLAPIGERAAANDCNVFAGQVVERIFQGDSLLVTVRLGGGEMAHLRLQNRAGNAGFSPEAGAHVSVLLHRADAHIVSAEA